MKPVTSRVGHWGVLHQPPFYEGSALAQVRQDYGHSFFVVTDNRPFEVGRDHIALLRNQPGFVLGSRRDLLPYGRWTCADGREVLFNRYYKPIWQRSAEGVVAAGNHDERVPFQKQEWFYQDGGSPWAHPESHAVCVAVLESFGLEHGGWLALDPKNRTPSHAYVRLPTGGRLAP